MATRLFTGTLLSINKSFSIPTFIISRTASSKIELNKMKILAVGAGNKPVPKAQEKITAMGCKDIKLLGIYNTKESFQQFTNALKERQWDAVALGSYVNGFDQAAHYVEPGVSTERPEILHWFNRVLNLVHELAPKSKIILLRGPDDLDDAVQRILGGEK